MVRKLGSFVFRTLRSLFLLHGIKDTQCGFKTCSARLRWLRFPKLQFFKQESRPKGWKVSAYDVELLYLFEKAGYAIKEVEVAWLNRDMSDTKGQQGDMARRYLRESIGYGAGSLPGETQRTPRYVLGRVCKSDSVIRHPSPPNPLSHFAGEGVALYMGFWGRSAVPKPHKGGG